MRILHVMAGAGSGGAENTFAEFTVAQKQQGLDVYAATRANPRNTIMTAAGIPVIELPFGGWFDFKTKRELKKRIAHDKPDVIVTWMNRAAKKLPRHTGVPWIARLGGYYDPKYYKGADHFIVLAPDIGRWLQDAGINKNKITVIPNFTEMPANVVPVSRAALDTPDDAFVFLSLSRLHKNKAIDTLLDAFAQLPKGMLWITGEGPEENKLKAQMRELGLESRVRFLGWRNDRWALLAACDALVFPSRHEPFGVSFVEPLAAGKPLVTTASQGPSQFIQDGVNGLVTPVDDSDALALAMQRVMSDPDLRARLTRAGQAEYQQVFEKKAILSKWQDVLSRLVKSR